MSVWFVSVCLTEWNSLAGEVYDKNPDYLIESWQDHEGLLESSALAIAQTPDGYIWVGTSAGLFRFNGLTFLSADKLSKLERLSGFVSFLQTDRSGRLWSGGEERLAVYNHGQWQRINGTNASVRSVAEEESGQLWIGGGTGELYTITNGAVERLQSPSGITPSGVFCITDAKDGHVWLANRGFIGRRNAAGWIRVVPPGGTTPTTLIAAPARDGGIWVYTPGQLRRIKTDGETTTFRAPSLSLPRDMIEDHNGTIWVTTITHGLAHFAPGGAVSFISTTNGLTHNAIRCVLEDSEGNIWAGGSLNGLNRLKPRQFLSIGRSEGLSDTVVRSIIEAPGGAILAGTHGGGLALIRDGRAEMESSVTQDTGDQYVWSLLRDRTGRLLIGTYNGGLFVDQNGARNSFSLPPVFLNAVAQILEDSHGRIWAGGPGALGIIEGDAMTHCFTNCIINGFAITCLAEDTNTDTMWVGTYGHGVFKINTRNLEDITPLPGLPGNRISSLKTDADGYLWIGVYEQGLACLHDGKVTLIGASQGLPALTIGSILDDGNGFFWLSTTHGILRISRDELRRLVAQPSLPVTVNLFNVSDGLSSDKCAEGYQPNSLLDHTGRLWFSTDRGVVTVNPSRLRLNSNPALVKFESVSYADRSGNHVITGSPASPMRFAAGTTLVGFDFAGLCYTAPEKVQFKYRLEGADNSWVNIGATHELHFRELSHGHYLLHLVAANNDGVWNKTETVFEFTVVPYIWQTFWFRLLAGAVLAIGTGLAVRRATRWQFQQRIDQMQRQRAVEQQARAEIQRREKYFRSLIEHASDAITVITPDTVVSYQSTSGERVLGYTAESMLGKSLIDFFHPDDHFKIHAALAQSLVQPGVPVTLVARMRHRDGSWHTVETVGTCVIGDAGQKEIILNTRDITEHLTLEEQLRQSQKMEAVGRLAGGVAHDFNNILSSLIMQNELLRMKKDLPQEIRDGLQQIAADSRRAADLVRQLLQFSRRQVMQLRLVDLNEVVTNMIRMLQRIIREDVKLELILHPAPLLTVADSGMIEQVILNLAVNARDAMIKGGCLGVETTEITLDTATASLIPNAAPGRYVCLRVTDTGGGISPEILPRIFEPFFTTKEPGKGTGLGLASDFGIVQQHHGWINVENLPGQGVTFCIYLPASNEKSPASVSEANSAKPRGGTETVLIVEDETAVRRSISMLLEWHGYKILEAANAADALIIWPQYREKVALLLTDLVMPGEFGGQELGRRLKLDRLDLKVIFISGYSSEIAGRDLQLRPGDAFVQKPFAAEHLLETVRRCLDTKPKGNQDIDRAAVSQLSQ
jgi:PAS domain S-box-containing protein